MISWDDFKISLKEQPRLRLLAAAILVGGVLYLLVDQPHDAEYYEDAGKEIEVAKIICETSTEWAQNHKSELKMNNNSLKHLGINGEPVTLKYVEYPKAILLHDGFVHKGAQIEFYCTFKDPRGRTGLSYFYDYDRQLWIDKTISRR